MYAFLLVPSDTYPVGALNRDGYETYGVISGGVILVAISGVGAGDASPHWLIDGATGQGACRI